MNKRIFLKAILTTVTPTVPTVALVKAPLIQKATPTISEFTQSFTVLLGPRVVYSESLFVTRVK